MESPILVNGQQEKEIPSVGSTERTCDQCGFTTFSLRVLYKHKYNCRGKQKCSSFTCPFCKRNFAFFSSFQKHKWTCVVRFKQKAIQKIHSKKPVEKHTVSPSIICPDCMTVFSDRAEYSNHIANGQCHTKPITQGKKKDSLSARKSLPNANNRSKRKRSLSTSNSDIDFIPKKPHLTNSSPKNNEPRVCGYCKEEYPTNNVLMRHLQQNPKCAASHCKGILREKSSQPLTARKSLSARKSFPSSKRKRSYPTTSTPFDVVDGSARKSFSPSFKSRNTTSIMHQCPVCYKDFSDTFSFSQHQKSLNHYGKATKSMSTTCKCPFCGKDYFSVKSRNAHISKHADVSQSNIRRFLKDTFCDVCSEAFGTKTARYQHMKTEHPDWNSSVLTEEDCNKLSFFSLPIKVKRELQKNPKSCPECKEKFPSVQIRNEHFQENHLDFDAECKFCQSKYSSVIKLERHMEKMHYDRFMFECVACDIKLASSPHVVLHVDKFHPHENSKEFIRAQDTRKAIKKLPQSSNRRTNQSSKRSDMDYFCKPCEVGFSTQAGLQLHRSGMNHKNKIAKRLNLSQPLSNSDNLECSECGEIYTSIRDFVPHRLSHLSDESNLLKINELQLYVCEICGDTMENHAKVQLHLFSHLQGATNEKSKSAKPQAKPTKTNAPNDHCARKSFSKPLNNNKQEVIIGGVAKSLYTCEACKVGFTSQQHYNLHVQKYCKAKPTPEVPSKAKESKTKAKDVATNAKTKSLKHCSLCKCLYLPSLKKVHDSVCKHCITQGRLSTNKDVEKLTSTTDLQKAVAACISCFCPFSDAKAFTDHMLQVHRSSDSVDSGKSEDEGILHCTSCRCVMLSSAVITNHEVFCKKPTYKPFDVDSCGDTMAAALDDEESLAFCIPCTAVFHDLPDLKKHLTLKHNYSGQPDQTNELSSNDAMDAASLAESNTIEDRAHMSDACASQDSNTLDEFLDLPEDYESMAKEPSINDIEMSDDTVINILRQNFSKLLEILVSDAELLLSIGYNDQPVDTVLMTVLQQMGQTPIEKDGTLSDVDHFRKNIQLFLDFCLKDHIIDRIGSENASTDEMVVHALKILSGSKEVEE